MASQLYRYQIELRSILSFLCMCDNIPLSWSWVLSLYHRFLLKKFIGAIGYHYWYYKSHFYHSQNLYISTGATFMSNKTHLFLTFIKIFYSNLVFLKCLVYSIFFYLSQALMMSNLYLYISVPISPDPSPLVVQESIKIF